VKIFEVTTPVREDVNGGYADIDDNGFQAERTLVIIDDDGNTVRLKNEQIGELYRFVKPVLAG